MPAGRLLAVDGHNLLYRAFFAIPELSTRAGRPTNAVFGFIRMLRQLERRWKPTHWAVALDGGIPRERLDLLPEYKANRPPMPAALREQIGSTERYLQSAGIPVLRRPEVEADDVLATLAVRTADDVGDVLIVSSDKDLFQIVDDRVGMVSPAKPEARIGPPEVREKTGVSPARIVEWLALTGDSVDNVPGVPGIGPKTAARLLDSCASLKDLLDNTGAVESASQRRALEENRERILRNLDLIRLKRDIAGTPGARELEVRPPDFARLLPFFEEMEFHSMAEDLRTGMLF